MKKYTLAAFMAAITGISASGSGYFPDILKIDAANSEQEIAELEREGVKVLRQRDELVLAFVPEEFYVESAGVRSGTRPGLGHDVGLRRTYPAMDVARSHYGADRIGEGRGLDKAYTGSGVVVGFCDIGFDPNHINWLDDKGETRLRKLVQYKELSGERIELTGTDAYRAWVTDDRDECHATHVGGILAGGYKAHGYQGTAPGADIVATVSLGSDVGLLAGAEDILEYARSVGKRAVINMSMSSYIGPHDGTSLFCQYLDKIGEEAVVCLSAGNEGNAFTNVSTTFSTLSPRTGALLYSSDWVQFNMSGYVDIWSADDSAFKTRMFAWDEMTGQRVFELDWVDSSEEYFMREFTSEDNPAMAEHFSGSVTIQGEPDAENGRRRMVVSLDTKTEETNGNHPWARYVWGLEVSGALGTHVDLYCDRQRVWFRNVPGLPGASSDMSVSDLATGRNTICVGMYVNRTEVPLAFGGTSTSDNGLNPGDVMPQSSYGTLHDGRIFPHTVAPGGRVVSSWSTPYLAGREELLHSHANDRADVGGQSYYWVTNSGTSMSSPYVAGYIATWLEANPFLTTAEIKEIIRTTNDRSKSVDENPRHGQGYFRPFEGLVSVLENSGIAEGTIGSRGDARMEWTGSELRIYNPAARALVLGVYSMDGRLVQNLTVDGTVVSEVPVGGGPGVYVCSLASVDGTGLAQLKILVH